MSAYVVLQRPDPTIEVEDAERWLNALDALMNDLPADLAAHREALTVLRKDSLRMLGRRVDRLRQAL